MVTLKLTLAFIISIIVNEKKMEIHAFRRFEMNSGVTLFALEDETIDIQCKQDVPMSYCGFVHPSGKRFSFSGNELDDGHCAKRITVSMKDEGEWRCHIGRKGMKVELMQKIQLRVVGKVAAVRRNVTAVHGKDVTLECATAEGMVPLGYCRFEPPNGLPFSIDSLVNRSNPILKKYYFPPNMSLDRGDCAVTIRNVKYEDVGTWTCGASLEDGKEHTDTIKLIVQGLYTMSTASATGVTFGALGIAVFLILLGYIGWKKRRILGAAPREPEVIEVQEMGLSREVERSPTGSRRGSRGSRRSPVATRSVPILVVQPPSEPSSSPLMQ